MTTALKPSLLTCPYRGEVIPRLHDDANNQARTCDHPDVRGPCFIGNSKDTAIVSCMRCKFWRTATPEAAAEAIEQAGGPLDPMQFAPPPALPSLSTRAMNAGIAYARWSAAGMPMRTPEEVAEIFQICQGCEYSIQTNDSAVKYCSHKHCGCRLATTQEVTNKIALATESCPVGKWGPQKTIVVNCDTHGYGDAVVMAWVAEGSRGGLLECRLYATGGKRQLLEALGQVVVDKPPPDMRRQDEQLKEESIYTRAIQRGLDQGLTTSPKRPPCLIDEDTWAWANRRFTSRDILLFPETCGKEREWPSSRWIELYELLKRDGRYRPHIFTVRQDSRYSALNYTHSAPWPPTMAAILVAAATVGNDSAPMHVAGTLDRPTFAILGATTEPVFAHMPSVKGIAVSPAELACVGCMFKPPFYPTCDDRCQALRMLSAGRVFESIMLRLGNHAGETSKAHPRRIREGWYRRWIRDDLPGLDIGCGNDPISPTFRKWDQALGDGDASHLVDVPDRTYGTVYASHVLEHMVDPEASLREWWRVVHLGGHLIVCVPHVVLYEGQQDLPSRWNGDHKTYWHTREPPENSPPHHRGLEQVIRDNLPAAEFELVSLELLNAGHHYPDKQRHPECEFSIEAIIKRIG